MVGMQLGYRMSANIIWVIAAIVFVPVAAVLLWGLYVERRIERLHQADRSLRLLDVCSQIRELKAQADELVQREPPPETDEDARAKWRAELQSERDRLWLNLLKLAFEPEAQKELERNFLS